MQWRENLVTTAMALQTPSNGAKIDSRISHITIMHVITRKPNLKLSTQFK